MYYKNNDSVLFIYILNVRILYVKAIIFIKITV